MTALDSRDSGDGELDALEVFGGETDRVPGWRRGEGRVEWTLGFPVGTLAERGTLNWAPA